jgi:hypothetical protein
MRGVAHSINKEFKTNRKDGGEFAQDCFNWYAG